MKAEHPPLLLASSSPRRREILTAAGYDFEAVGIQVDEDLNPGEGPESGAVRLALAKAEAGRRHLPVLRGLGTVILAADTMVSVGSEILGKPADALEAKSMLKKLSGRVHEVHTGWCVEERVKADAGVVVSQVKFRKLSNQEIERYVATGEPMDKAGAYGIQGAGVFLVDWIQGSYPNIVGLPLAEIKRALDPALKRLKTRPASL